MNNYNWTEFKNSPLFIEINEFFGRLKELGKEDEKRVFVFISVEAVCLFLLWKKKGELQDWTFPTYSDRYVMKNLDSDFLRDSAIILVDDAIITGKHLKQIYHMLEEKTKAKNILPVVFAADRRIWADEEKRNQDKAFLNLEFKNCWTGDEILKFSSIENLLFYQGGIPYTIELPIMKAKNSSETGVTVSEEQFEHIKEGDSMWGYYSCPQVGYRQNDTTCGMLMLKNHVFSFLFSEFFLAMTVRVQIIPGDGQIRLIFVPFAILKSVKFQKLLSFFYTLYEGTEYAEQVKIYEQKTSKEEFARKTYVLLHRAVAFSISKYIGEELKKYVKNVCDIELDFDNSHNILNFDEYFEDAAVKGWNENSREILKRVLSQGLFEKIECRPAFGKMCSEYFSREYSYKRAYNFILEVINDVRHGKLGNSNEHMCRFVTIEELEFLFTQVFYGADDAEIRNCLIGCIGSTLNQGCLANELFYDNQKDIVYRGFCYGENSDAFYDVSAKVFCAAVLKYYEIVGRDYLKKYDVFIMHLFRFFKDNFLLEGFISLDEFAFYSKYFRLAGDDGFEYQIENKKFLIEIKVPYYIEMVQEYVSGLDFEGLKD